MKRSHHHLVCGEVMFHDKDNPAAVGTIKLNTTIVSDSKDVPSRQIGQAQKMLQMLMFKRLEDPTIVVVDVCILSVSYLGHMTRADFLKPSDDPELQDPRSPFDTSVN